MSYSRKIFIINPQFQLRISLYISLLVFITSLIYPYTIYKLMENIILHFSLKSPEIANRFSEMRFSLILFLILMQIGFTLVTFCICIFFSHRIAGPLYKLQKYLREVRENGYKDKLFFRKNDYFPEVAEDLNSTLELLEDNHKKDLIYLEEINSYLNNLKIVVPEDKKIVLNEISNKLSEMQNRYSSKI